MSTRFYIDGLPDAPLNEKGQLPTRLANVLSLMGVSRLCELNGVSYRQLMREPNMGRKSWNDLAEIVSENGGQIVELKTAAPLRKDLLDTIQKLRLRRDRLSKDLARCQCKINALESLAAARGLMKPPA